MRPLLMAHAGYKIIGIIEVTGSVYNRNGIDVEALSAYRQKHGTLAGFPEAEAADPAELLVTDCDILIPAATENQITSRNADRVKCKILAEGANGPTTASADEILADKGVFVIPDILCNAGGVTTSYFEWVQDRQGYFWKESLVNEQLETSWWPLSRTWSGLPKLTASITGLRLTCWRLIAWLTRFGSVESTHRMREL